jgi:hypothetical protein
MSENQNNQQTFSYHYGADVYTLFGSWPITDVDRIQKLHQATWDANEGQPTKSGPIAELATIDHPLARCLVLLYNQRGASLERFGLTYQAGPKERPLRDIALQTLKDDPIVYKDNEAAAHWYAIFALMYTGLSEDIPVLLPFLESPDAALPSLTLTVLYNIELREPGTIQAFHLQDKIDRLAKTDPNEDVRNSE